MKEEPLLLLSDKLKLVNPVVLIDYVIIILGDDYMTKKRQRREFTEEFKQQMVQLYNNGKSKADINREYDLTPSALNRWIQRYNATGSTKEADNRTPEEAELIKLRKELQQLRMENDILKQAALIFGRK